MMGASTRADAVRKEIGININDVSTSLRQIQSTEENLRQGREAAEALKWFIEYAKPTMAATEVFKVDASVIARSTGGAQVATKYLQRALDQHLGQILEEAIENAKADLMRVRMP